MNQQQKDFELKFPKPIGVFWNAEDGYYAWMGGEKHGQKCNFYQEKYEVWLAASSFYQKSKDLLEKTIKDYGNWSLIRSECQDHINSIYIDKNGKKWKFFGVVYGFDDFYYGMMGADDSEGNPEITLLSCVGSIEGFGFSRIEPFTTQNNRLAKLFIFSCTSFRQGGYTDVFLTSCGQSFFRGPNGIEPMESPSPSAESIKELVEVILGKDEMEKIENGGQLSVVWSGMRVTISKPSKIAPFSLAARL